MICKRLITWAALGLLTAGSLVRAGAQTAPPPDTHGDDILWGRDQNFGTTGNGTGLWFSDSPTNPGRLATWLATPHTMLPNIIAPDSDPATLPSQGNIYFNLGSNQVTYLDGNGNAHASMGTGTMSLVSISPGLEVWKSQYRFFAPTGTPTAINETFPYPYVGTWHNHFAVRAFRPGTYTFSFKMTGVTAADNTHLTDSPTYTVTFQSRPVMTGKIALTGWARTDTSRNLTGNRAEIYIFPANSNPTMGSQAIATTNVYLDNAGNFAIPENITGVTDGGSYRIGVRPLTAVTGLTRLVPGNVTLSTSAPGNMGTLPIFLGDVNGDGYIDEDDYNQVVQNFYKSTGESGFTINRDVNGDGYIDEDDYNTVVQNFYQSSDFTP